MLVIDNGGEQYAGSCFLIATVCRTGLPVLNQGPTAASPQPNAGVSRFTPAAMQALQVSHRWMVSVHIQVFVNVICHLLGLGLSAQCDCHEVGTLHLIVSFSCRLLVTGVCPVLALNL